MKTLAIVPARGNSKSVPRKNLANVCGKPLIWYTLDCALRSRLLDRIIVSTEDDGIAAVAESMEITVERRPLQLCRDDTSTLAVLQWHLNQQDDYFDAILCLQPTCPLRLPVHIDGAINVMESTRCNCVISFVRCEDEHPARMYEIAHDGRMSPYNPLYERARRQDLPPMYRRSGDIYLLSREAVSAGEFYDIRPLLIGREFHCNVDGPLDLVWARKRVSMLTGVST